MKKTLVVIAALLMTAAVTYGQGQVNFNNRVPNSGIDAQVKLAGGSLDGQGAGMANGLAATDPGAYAQLAIVGTGGSLTFVGTPVGFRNNSAAAAFYIDPNRGDTAPTFPGNTGQAVTVRMVAWLGASGSSYTTAASKGNSNDISVTPAVAPATPPDLVGLTGFSINVVPEPSTLAFGVLGLGGLMLARRRK